MAATCSLWNESCTCLRAHVCICTRVRACGRAGARRFYMGGKRVVVCVAGSHRSGNLIAFFHFRLFLKVIDFVRVELLLEHSIFIFLCFQGTLPVLDVDRVLAPQLRHLNLVLQSQVPRDRFHILCRALLHGFRCLRKKIHILQTQSLGLRLPCLRRLLRTRFGTDDLRGVSNSGLHQSLLHQLTSKRSCRARNEYADKKHLRETFFSNLAPARAVSASHLASTLRPSRHPNAQCGAPLPSIRLGARAWTCGSHEHICSRSRNMLHILLTC